jgi:hypothetical protein
MAVAIMLFISHYYIFSDAGPFSQFQKQPYPDARHRDTLFTFNIMQTHG